MAFTYSFPALKGRQATRDYFVAMCPLRTIPKIFLFDEEEVSAEVRAQRTLNRQRVPEMAQYILENPEDYVFSALTASIDGHVEFEPVESAGPNMGTLHIEMTSRLLINDGQHRRAAIEEALKRNPDIGDETVAVVFFLDPELKRCQQLFSDLNRYAIRTSKSLSIMYDHRNDESIITKGVALRCKVFEGLVEVEKSTLAARSKKLFTLSALHTANEALLAHAKNTDVEQLEKLAINFWTAVSERIPEWGLVRDGKMLASEVRQDFIHTHAIALQALGIVGHQILTNNSENAVNWSEMLDGLGQVDWRKSNTGVWEGRALINGRVSKTSQSVSLTACVVKRALGLVLSDDELEAEQKIKSGKPHE